MGSGVPLQQKDQGTSYFSTLKSQQLTRERCCYVEKEKDEDEQIPDRCGYFPSWKLICATAATNTAAHAQKCIVGSEPLTKDDSSAGINQVTKTSSSWYHRDLITILALCSVSSFHRNPASITLNMSTLHLYGLCVSFNLTEYLFILTLVRCGVLD